MKKLFILCLVMLFMSIAATVFAGGTGGYTTGQFTIGTETPLSISTSKDVNMSIQTSTTTGTAPNLFVANWVMATYHKAGSRTFGTSNADQKIWFHETPGYVAPTVGDPAGVAPDWAGAGWGTL